MSPNHDNEEIFQNFQVERWSRVVHEFRQDIYVCCVNVPLFATAFVIHFILDNEYIGCNVIEMSGNKAQAKIVLCAIWGRCAARLGSLCYNGLHLRGHNIGLQRSPCQQVCL